MGTSKGYQLPSGGNWTPLKKDATSFAKGSSSVTAGVLLRQYIRANGGARAIAHGRDYGTRSAPTGASRQSGRGGGGGGGAARNTARNLGHFLSRLASVGLDQALREEGLSKLVGRPADEVAAGLLDVLTSPASTLDEAAARKALAALNDELLAKADTYEDVQRILSESLDKQGLARIIASFFGHYLYERFCRDFYEQWVRKVGSSEAARLLKSIKDYIRSALKAKFAARDITRVNWRSREGMRLIEQVMQDTLDIFEVTA